MRHLKLVLFSVVMVAVLSFAGCHSKVITGLNEGTEPGGKVDLPGAQARMNNVGFLTPGLNKRVAVQQSNAQRTPTNTLQVYCELRNRTQYKQQLQVRTQFFGAQGEPLEGPNAWQNVFLAPNGIQTYRTYSTRTDPAYYYIEVMEMP